MYFDVEDFMGIKNFLYLAYKYKKYDNVKAIQINQEGEAFHIQSHVRIFDQSFHCSIDIDEEDYVTYQCNCGNCHQYEPCAHIGAVMLKLNSLEIEEYPFTFVESDDVIYEEELKPKQIEYLLSASHHMITSHKTKYLKDLRVMMNDEKYRIVPKFDYNVLSTAIYYKIGNEKLYKIKDVDTFLGNIENRKEISYGKYLKFIHDKNAFDDFALKQIQFMRHSLYGDDLELNGYGNDKCVYLESSNLDDFFDLYSQYDAFDEVTFLQADELFPVIIEETDDFYKIKLEDIFTRHNLLVGKKHIYHFTHILVDYDERKKATSDHYIYERYLLDETGTMHNFFYQLTQGPICVTKEDFPDFFKYVLSPMQSYVKFEGLTDLHMNEYVNMKLYGDVVDYTTICFQLFYEDDDFNRVPAFQDNFVTTYEQDLVENYLQSHCDQLDKENHCVYFDINQEKTYQFIHEDLEKIKQYCEVYVTEALRNIGKSTKYSMTVCVAVASDLLALDIESVEIPKMEIGEVLSRYRKKQKFYRLKNGELLYLDSPELEELSQIMDKYHLDTNDMTDGVIYLDKNRAFSLEEDTKTFSNLQFKQSQGFQQMMTQLEKTYESYELSPYYQSLLRDYQKEGVQWLRKLCFYNFNGILADDMGLGKTLQVIALLDELQLTQPSLVICPASLIYNWEEEIMKFAQNLSVQCIVGKQSCRQQAISQVNKYQVNITSYDYLRKDVDLYQNCDFGYVILDEAQYIKNQKTRNAITVKTLKAQHKLALSGTPIENSLAELWSIFDFLMPHYLFHYRYFQETYETKIIKENNQEAIHQLKKMVSPFVLRRNKKDVLTELPDKIETTQVIPFNEEESQLYYAYFAQANQELQKMLEVDKLDQMAILSLLTKLRQICCEPRMLFEHFDKMSSKMKACMEFICYYKEHNQKILLFSTFTSVFEFMEPELKMNGISYLILTGQTSKEKRKEYVKMFQEGRVDVFLISLRAGGTGLNLTQAEVVIHFDPWWNISAQNQATDRAYRMGQKHNVIVHKLIMKDSIEEKIVKLQEKKKELSDMFVETSTGHIVSMSKDDILELFK